MKDISNSIHKYDFISIYERIYNLGTLSQLYMNIGVIFVGRQFIKSLGQLYNSMVKTDLFVLLSDIDNK